MALTLSTLSPTALLAAIKQAIDSKTVTTWSYDKDGDFTHTPDQWKHRAWLRPRVQSGQLILSTIPPYGKPITWEVYGVYMGRFAEMAIAHFHGSITTAVATASPSATDQTQ